MSRFEVLFRLVALSSTLALLMGCTSGKEASVSGKVTLDGAPLDDANISFVPLSDGQRDAGWATVSQGGYSIPASSGLGIGKFRVEIRALRALGETTNRNDPSLLNAKEIIPSRYNSKSELIKEIKTGENNADFDLTSK